MTSKLTITDDKLSALLSEMERSFTGCQGHGYIDAAEEYGDMISALRELQECRKAEQDSEPVFILEVARADYKGQKLGNHFGFITLDAARELKEGNYQLYRHAQQPVVPDRSIFEKWWESQNGAPLDGWDSLRATDGYYDDGIDGQFEAWNACRAAMLQAGNSPVIPDGKSVTASTGIPVIPDGYVIVPKEPTEAMMLHKSGCQHHAWDDPDCAMRQTRRLIWSHMLAAAPHDTPALNSVQSVDSVAGKWIPVSERLPSNDPGSYEYLVYEILNNRVQHDYWNSEGEHSNLESFWNHYGNYVTHWMPLPAAPQEVKGE